MGSWPNPCLCHDTCRQLRGQPALPALPLPPAHLLLAIPLMMQLRVGAFPTIRRLSTISTLPPTIRNIANCPLCDHPVSETVEHLLIDCPRWQDLRDALWAAIGPHTSTCWLLALTAKDAALHDDLRRACAAAGAITSVEDLERLAIPLLQSVCKEALRMYPSVPLFCRTNTEDLITAGHRIAANTEIIISPYVQHRLPYGSPHHALTHCGLLPALHHPLEHISLMASGKGFVLPALLGLQRHK